MLYANQVVMAGNVDDTPTLRYTGRGAAVCTFPLHCQRVYVSKDEPKTETLYIDVVTYGTKAPEVEKSLKEGMNIMVVGRIAFQAAQDPQGQKSGKHVIVASDIIHSQPNQPA